MVPSGSPASAGSSPALNYVTPHNYSIQMASPVQAHSASLVRAGSLANYSGRESGVISPSDPRRVPPASSPAELQAMQEARLRQLYQLQQAQQAQQLLAGGPPPQPTLAPAYVQAFPAPQQPPQPVKSSNVAVQFSEKDYQRR